MKQHIKLTAIKGFVYRTLIVNGRLYVLTLVGRSGDCLRG